MTGNFDRRLRDMIQFDNLEMFFLHKVDKKCGSKIRKDGSKMRVKKLSRKLSPKFKTWVEKFGRENLVENSGQKMGQKFDKI
mgnify:CR=1 FL=1